MAMPIEEIRSNAGLGRIGVAQGSCYAHLNGQAFPIKEKVGNRISLDIKGQTTDFYGCEVSVFTEICGWVAYGVATKWGLTSNKHKTV